MAAPRPLQHAWSDELNLLTTRFWYGCGNIADLAPWTAKANSGTWEVHPDVWSLQIETDPGAAESTLLRLAGDLNGFTPVSAAGEPYAARVLAEQLRAYEAGVITPHRLCTLVRRLDSDFISVAITVARAAGFGSYQRGSWMGKLWDACDWCEEDTTRDERPWLLEEAQRVLQLLATESPQAPTP